MHCIGGLWERCCINRWLIPRLSQHLIPFHLNQTILDDRSRLPLNTSLIGFSTFVATQKAACIGKVFNRVIALIDKLYALGKFSRVIHESGGSPSSRYKMSANHKITLCAPHPIMVSPPPGMLIAIPTTGHWTTLLDVQDHKYFLLQTMFKISLMCSLIDDRK